MVALILIAIAEDPKLCHYIDKGMYDIILAFLKALLVPRSWFWLKTVRNLENLFYRQLRYIVIDEAYVIWG